MRSHKPSLHHRPLTAHVQQQFKLERWHRRSLYALVALLLVSGLAWLLAHFALRVPGEFGDTIHPLEHWAMQVHGALIVPACVLIGSLLFQHMRRAHRAGRNRNSGWSMVIWLSWLAISGYGLYYFASENSRPLWSVAHWAAGCALPALLCLHIWLGRRMRAG